MILINFHDSNLFTPVTHPTPGVTHYVLTRRVAPVQQGFYFVNDSMSAASSKPIEMGMAG